MSESRCLENMMCRKWRGGPCGTIKAIPCKMIGCSATRSSPPLEAASKDLEWAADCGTFRKFALE